MSAETPQATAPRRTVLTTILRWAKFAASTLVGTAVDTAVLYLCAHILLDGTYWGENIVSPSISFFCATIANYIVAYLWVWKDRIRERSAADFCRRYVGYFSTCIGGFLIKMFFLQVFCLVVDWDVVILNLLALCFSGIFTFFVNEFLVFRRH